MREPEARYNPAIMSAPADPVDTFIARWQVADNAYVFERRVVFRHGDGDSSNGYIDCFRHACFVLEAKQTRLGEAAGKVFDDALLRARSQAENYARALPAGEGRPPFLVVVDVGNVIELYAEFSRSGATYVPFPDPRSHRIRLADLRDAALRARLAAVWLDPLSLDPTRYAARVTREIAVHLAALAKLLEADGHAPETVAGFLTRCLFSMFAEDVGLIPKGSFKGLLDECAANPAAVPGLLGGLWRDMDSGTGFSAVVRAALPPTAGPTSPPTKSSSNASSPSTPNAAPRKRKARSAGCAPIFKHPLPRRPPSGWSRGARGSAQLANLSLTAPRVPRLRPPHRPSANGPRRSPNNSPPSPPPSAARPRPPINSPQTSPARAAGNPACPTSSPPSKPLAARGVWTTGGGWGKVAP
jgi:hypothetical protein